MRTFAHLVFLLISSCLLFVDVSTDTILHGQSITASNTIVPAGNDFELGFLAMNLCFYPAFSTITTCIFYYYKCASSEFMQKPRNMFTEQCDGYNSGTPVTV
ncbi:unnamed protein product [Camellia sinensis]